MTTTTWVSKVSQLRLILDRTTAENVSEDSIERFPEFQIEDGVDYWVKDGVDVTQPSCHQERSHRRLDIFQLELDWDCWHDVTDEKRNPTTKKAT